MIKHFAFCADSLLLTSDWQVLTELPVVDFCFPSPLTSLRCEKDWIRIYRLDYPVTNILGYEMKPLRQAFFHLDEVDYTLASKAAELLYWDSNSKYCGCCGGMMRWKSDISKQCGFCGKELWPSLATAIIVRITRGEEILLIQTHKFKNDMYGLVAGFVETGESLEACVVREVMEETNIQVRQIRYFGSQSWPFPCGLMVAFTAEYAGGELRIDKSEVRKAQWFSREYLPRIPDEASIARWLIDDWMKSC